MQKSNTITAALLAVFALLLASCGGGGGGSGSDAPRSSMALRASVSGLASGRLEIADHRNNRLSITSNREVAFAQDLTSGEAYHVRILHDPASQVCSATNASGVAQSPVGTVTISCTGGYTLGGTVSGLQGTGLKLLNNRDEHLSISADGAFTFPGLFATGAPYRVEVGIAPDQPLQQCTATNGAGVIGASNVESIRIDCHQVEPRILLLDTPEYMQIYVYDARLARFRLRGFRDNADSSKESRFTLVYPVSEDYADIVSFKNLSTSRRLNLRTAEFTELGTGVQVSGASGDTVWMRHPNNTAFYTVNITGGGSNPPGLFVWDEESSLIVRGSALPGMVGRGYTLSMTPAGDWLFLVGTSLWTYATDPMSGELRSETDHGYGSNIEPVNYKTQRFAYFIANASDQRLNALSIDPQTGRLTALNTPMTASETPRPGPPGHEYVYSGRTPHTIDPETGALVPTGASGLPDGVSRTGAFHPNGKHYYGHFTDRVAAFDVDARTGQMSEIANGGFSVASRFTTNTASVDPSGRLLYFRGDTGLHVLRLDQTTGAVNGEVQIPLNTGGDLPVHTAIATRGPADFYSKFAYVVNSGDSSVTALRLTAAGVLEFVGAYATGGLNSVSSALDPHNRFLYVLNRGSTDISIFAIDADTGALTPVGAPLATIADPTSIAMAASGVRAYVASGAGAEFRYYSVNPLDGLLDPLASNVPLVEAATSLHVHPAFPAVLAMNAASGNWFAAGTHPAGSVTIPSVLRIDDPGGAPVSLAVGAAPSAMTTDSIGRRLFVAHETTDRLTQYSLGERGYGFLEIESSGPAFDTGSQPRALAVEPRDRFVYVANAGSDDVSVFEIAPEGLLAEVVGSPFAVCRRPTDLKFENSGSRLLVVCAADAAVMSFDIDADDGSLNAVAGSSVPIGAGATSLQITSHVR